MSAIVAIVFYVLEAVRKQSRRGNETTQRGTQAIIKGETAGGDRLEQTGGLGTVLQAKGKVVEEVVQSDLISSAANQEILQRTNKCWDGNG